MALAWGGRSAASAGHEQQQKHCQGLGVGQQHMQRQQRELCVGEVGMAKKQEQQHCHGPRTGTRNEGIFPLIYSFMNALHALRHGKERIEAGCVGHDQQHLQAKNSSRSSSRGVRGRVGVSVGE
jgi:hypothetical protein